MGMMCWVNYDFENVTNVFSLDHGASSSRTTHTFAQYGTVPAGRESTCASFFAYLPHGLSLMTSLVAHPQQALYLLIDTLKAVASDSVVPVVSDTRMHTLSNHLGGWALEDLLFGFLASAMGDGAHLTTVCSRQCPWRWRDASRC